MSKLPKKITIVKLPKFWWTFSLYISEKNLVSEKVTSKMWVTIMLNNLKKANQFYSCLFSAKTHETNWARVGVHISTIPPKIVFEKYMIWYLSCMHVWERRHAKPMKREGQRERMKKTPDAFPSTVGKSCSQAIGTSDPSFHH